MTFTELQARAVQLMSKYNYANLVQAITRERMHAFYIEHRAQLDAVQTKEACIDEINRRVSETQWISIDVVSWIGLTEEDVDALWQLFLEWRQEMRQ